LGQRETDAFSFPQKKRIIVEGKIICYPLTLTIEDGVFWHNSPGYEDTCSNNYSTPLQIRVPYTLSLFE
jgi:hypothetical protein